MIAAPRKGKPCKHPGHVPTCAICRKCATSDKYCRLWGVDPEQYRHHAAPEPKADALCLYLGDTVRGADGRAVTRDCGFT